MVYAKEFMEFVKEYKVAGLAIGFIIGGAATTLVQSLVKDVIMPLIAPLIPGGAWQEATFSLGPFMIRWGSFLGNLINFLIVAYAVFLIAKLVLREEKVAKR